MTAVFNYRVLIRRFFILNAIMWLLLVNLYLLSPCWGNSWVNHTKFVLILVVESLFYTITIIACQVENRNFHLVLLVVKRRRRLQRRNKPWISHRWVRVTNLWSILLLIWSNVFRQGKQRSLARRRLFVLSRGFSSCDWVSHDWRLLTILLEHRFNLITGR